MSWESTFNSTQFDISQHPPQHRCFLCWLVKSWGTSSQSSGTYCQAFVFYVSHEQWMCRITISISPFTCTKLPRYFVLPPTSPFQDDPWPCRLSSTSFVRSKDYSCTENITIPSFQNNPIMWTHKITIPSFLPRPDGFLPATASILPVDDRIDLVMIMLIKMVININSMMEGQHQNQQN